jgi:hypothetical protein
MDQLSDERSFTKARNTNRDAIYFAISIVWLVGLAIGFLCLFLVR